MEMRKHMLFEELAIVEEEARIQAEQEGNGSFSFNRFYLVDIIVARKCGFRVHRERHTHYTNYVDYDRIHCSKYHWNSSV